MGVIPFAMAIYFSKRPPMATMLLVNLVERLRTVKLFSCRSTRHVPYPREESIVRGRE